MNFKQYQGKQFKGKESFSKCHTIRSQLSTHLALMSENGRAELGKGQKFVWGGSEGISFMWQHNRDCGINSKIGFSSKGKKNLVSLKKPNQIKIHKFTLRNCTILVKRSTSSKTRYISLRLRDQSYPFLAPQAVTRGHLPPSLGIMAWVLLKAAPVDLLGSVPAIEWAQNWRDPRWVFRIRRGRRI